MTDQEISTQLQSIKKEALKALSHCDTLDLLENWKQAYLSRKSKFNDILKNLGKIGDVDTKKLSANWTIL